MCSLNYDFTILYKIFPMGYLEWSRLLIATIEFTILKNSKKNIVNYRRSSVDYFLGSPL